MSPKSCKPNPTFSYRRILGGGGTTQWQMKHLSDDFESKTTADQQVPTEPWKLFPIFHVKLVPSFWSPSTEGWTGLLDYKGRETKLLLPGCEIRITGERRQARVVPDPTSVHKHNRKHPVKKSNRKGCNDCLSQVRKALITGILNWKLSRRREYLNDACSIRKINDHQI